jgi:AcrR family transcriptional regulator
MRTSALPRGRHATPREVVAASQRERMLAAMAEAVGEKGYGPVAVADVIARAGVSRKTFYEHFSDKEECFIAAWDTGVALLIDAVTRATLGAEGDWKDRLHAGVRAYLHTLVSVPAFARTFLIEVLAAGPRALDRRAQVHQRFAELLRTLHERQREVAPELPELPDEVFTATVGAVEALVAERVRQGRIEELPELEPVITYIQVAFLAGHERAARELGRA